MLNSETNVPIIRWESSICVLNRLVHYYRPKTLQPVFSKWSSSIKGPSTDHIFVTTWTRVVVLISKWLGNTVEFKSTINSKHPISDIRLISWSPATKFDVLRVHQRAFDLAVLQPRHARSFARDSSVYIQQTILALENKSNSGITKAVVASI